jgi:hypothetical protein
MSNSAQGFTYTRNFPRCPDSAEKEIQFTFILTVFLFQYTSLLIYAMGTELLRLLEASLEFSL